MDKKLVIVGGGKMGEALLAGLLQAGWADASELAVIEKIDVRRAELAARFPDVEIAPGVAPYAAIKGAVIAVKPYDVVTACDSLRAAGVGQVLSIAAGVTIAQLENAVGPDVVVVRGMPNTAALVGAGVSAIAGSTKATRDDLAWAESILGAVGAVVRVGEPLLDAVTGLSGSGPAYVFLVAEAMIDAGVLVGLTRDVSRTLALHTLLGAARLLVESGDSPETLRAAVTSPGGTTAAGLRALEAAAVRSAFLDAVVAATDRATELGRQAEG